MPFLESAKQEEGQTTVTATSVTSIQSAIDAAVANGATASNPSVINVGPKSGGWDGNVTLYPGIILQGANSLTDLVKINGGITFSCSTGSATTNLAEISGFHVVSASGTRGLTYGGTAASSLRVRNMKFTKTGAGEEVILQDGGTSLSGIYKDIEIVKVTATGTAILIDDGVAKLERIESKTAAAVFLDIDSIDGTIFLKDLTFYGAPTADMIQIDSSCSVEASGLDLATGVSGGAGTTTASKNAIRVNNGGSLIITDSRINISATTSSAYLGDSATSFVFAANVRYLTSDKYDDETVTYAAIDVAPTAD